VAYEPLGEPAGQTLDRSTPTNSSSASSNVSSLDIATYRKGLNVFMSLQVESTSLVM
jgi:hypothetical protein